MTMNDDEFLESLREDFTAESTDLLETAESEVLQFEKDNNPQHLIEVNRSLHSLKGSARAVGYSEYSEVLHNLETAILTSTLKAGDPVRFRTSILKALDALKELTNAYSQKQELTIKKKLAAAKLIVSGF
jgi:chemotaxis protein histidine kinase CheA